MGWGRNLMAATVVALAGVAMTACKSIPLSEQPTRGQRTPSMQEELRTVSHWQALAAHTAKQIADTLGGDGKPAKSFYVEPLDPGMAFGRTFESSLVTELVRHDLPVSLTRDDSYRVHVSVEAIKHDRFVNPPPSGTLVLLAGGLWALDRYLTSDQVDDMLADAALPLAALEAAKFFKMFGNLSEVSITVSVADGDRLMARTDSTYYVEGKEIDQFAATRPEKPLLVHRPAWTSEPMRVREFPVSGQ